MKQTILTIATMLALTLVAQADQYVLVMSKDDEVCQSVLKIYNNDLRELGKIIPENHKEFNWIIWEETNTEQVNGRKFTGSDYKVSLFDINNDGIDELVIRNNFYLTQGIIIGPETSENIIYTDKNYYEHIKEGMTLEDLRKIENKVFVNPNASRQSPYSLPKLPIQWSADNSGNQRDYPVFIDHFFSRPMKYRNRYYIAMFANLETRSYFDETNISILTQFNANNMIEHICYFLRLK